MYGTSQQRTSRTRRRNDWYCTFVESFACLGRVSLGKPFQTFLMVSSGTEDASFLLYDWESIFDCFRLPICPIVSGFLGLFWTSFEQSFAFCIQHDCWARGVEISVCLHRRFCDRVRHVLYVYVGAKQGALWVRFGILDGSKHIKITNADCSGIKEGREVLGIETWIQGIMTQASCYLILQQKTWEEHSRYARRPRDALTFEAMELEVTIS